MLLDGLLQEEFHYTPYSTISYLVAGPRAARLLRPAHNGAAAVVAVEEEVEVVEDGSAGGVDDDGGG
ncbi:hypothetical protein HK405_007644, partial [Cladochytrium tenue]